VPEVEKDTKADFGEAYNKVAAGATLRDIKLVATKFDVLPTFFSESDKVKLHVNNSIEDVQFDPEGEFVLGAFVYEVRAMLGRKRVLHCKGHFIVVYDVQEGVEEEPAKAFCARVGFFAAYPYFRALFATVSRFGGAELPVLPVISSPPVKRVEPLSTTEGSPATSPA
jgi:hypothetical protein